MGIKDEVAIVINAIEAIIALAEKLDPNAANNVLVVEAQKVLNFLKIFLG
jgi:hypothetical protein